MEVLTLQPSTVSGIANGSKSLQTTILAEGVNAIEVLINITAAGGATGTLQLFIQDSCDGGVTWDDLISSNTFTFGAAITRQRFFISGEIATTATQGSANQLQALGAGTVRGGPFGDRLKVVEVVSGASGSPTGVTYTISAVAKE